jgi:hypothetical protein
MSCPFHMARTSAASTRWLRWERAWLPLRLQGESVIETLCHDSPTSHDPGGGVADVREPYSAEEGEGGREREGRGLGGGPRITARKHRHTLE